MKGVFEMSDEKISGDDLKELMDYFVYDIILQKRKWIGMEWRYRRFIVYFLTMFENCLHYGTT